MNKAYITLLSADISPAHHRRRPAYAATLPRQVYETSFWRSEEVYESSSHDRVYCRLGYSSISETTASSLVGRFWVETIGIPRAEGCRPMGSANIKVFVHQKTAATQKHRGTSINTNKAKTTTKSITVVDTY